jgi:triphosphoribosyl-dephospho-CoA synthase
VSGLTRKAIAAAFIASCRDEIEAPKPGNVHTVAGGHDMEARHFLDSARVAAPQIAARGARVGARIRSAVGATFAEVGMNTNLGILLLCAPLARAAESNGDLRPALRGVLKDMDAQDAADVYAAIARASPGGLGRASRYDVHEPPRSSLIEAMQEAAGRDMIARQYAADFTDIFDTGLPAAAQMRSMAGGLAIALGVYLTFLSQFLDTHIVRKHGVEIAEAIMREARVFATRARSESDEQTFISDLLAFDMRLKRKRINPGTSADLTVATLFAARLSGILPISPGDG